jgi:hypothetical protein
MNQNDEINNIISNEKLTNTIILPQNSQIQNQNQLNFQNQNIINNQRINNNPPENIIKTNEQNLTPQVNLNMNMGNIQDDNSEENKNLNVNKGNQLKEQLLKNTNLFDINNLMKSYKEGEGRGNNTDFKFFGNK